MNVNIWVIIGAIVLTSLVLLLRLFSWLDDDEVALIKVDDKDEDYNDRTG